MLRVDHRYSSSSPYISINQSGIYLMRVTSSLFRSLFLTFGVSVMALPAGAQTKADPAKPDLAKSEPVKAAVPPEPAVTTASYGSWVLRCVQVTEPAQTATDASKSGRASIQTCEVIQSVQVQGQSQPIAQVAIGRLPGDKDLILTALVPVNIALPGGIHLSGNGKTGAEEKGGLELSWQRCMSGACIATAKPETTVLGVLRREEAGQIRFVDASGNTIAIPLSWTGLDQALAALDKVR